MGTQGAYSEWALPGGMGGDIIYLSLKEALELALINNFDVQFALYDRLIKDADIDEAKSVYDTVLKLNADYTYDRKEQASSLFGTSSHTGQAGMKLTKKLITGTDVSIDFQNIRESSDSAFSTLNPSYESYTEIKFTQPLLRNFFGMNDWADVKIARIDVRNFSLETLDKIETNLADVEEAYWDLVLSVELVDVEKEMYEKAKEFYEISRKKKKLGTSEITDLLAAEANMATRKTELIIEENTLKTAMNKLRLLINYPNATGILPISTIGITGANVTLLESLKISFEKRRDYKRAKNEIKAKRIKFNMKRNDRWPQLDFEGSLKLNGIERKVKDSMADAFTRENPEYNARVTFSIPLENRSERSAYNKAKHEKAKALLNLKKMEKVILADIDDAVRDVNVNKIKAEERLKIESLQKRKLEEELKQFGFGRSDSDRVIRFQEDLLRAKRLALNALKDYKDSLIELYLKEGIFLEKRGLTVE